MGRLINILDDISSRLQSLAKTVPYVLYLYSGYVPLRDCILARSGRSRVVVLYYHRIGARDILSKPTEEFRRDLEYLKSRYECISLSRMCEHLAEGKTLRRRTAVLTFDDGYRDNYTEAVPALKAAGLTGTFFVATGFIGTERDFPHDVRTAEVLTGTSATTDGKYPKLTWDDLRAMQAAGFEIGSHTVNHTNLGYADQQTIECELRESLTALNRELGQRPRAFAFPWGQADDISQDAIEAAQRAGYYVVVHACSGMTRSGSWPPLIGRIDAGNGHISQLGLRARLAGFDPDKYRGIIRKGHTMVRKSFARSMKSFAAAFSSCWGKWLCPGPIQDE